MAKFSLSNLGSVFKMIGAMKANPDKAAEILASMPDDVAAEIVKAQSAMRFEGTREIKDLWQEGQFHVNPTSGEIPIGPPLAARGGQAHREIKIYSDLERQEGLSEQQIAFQSQMGMLGESMKAIASGIQFLVGKAAEDKEEDKMADDEAEKAESDAKKSLEKAQSLVVRATDLRDEADCETGETRKAMIVKSKNLRTNAGHELAKAQLNARAIASVKAKAASSASLLSTIKALAEKSNVVIKAKDDDDMDDGDAGHRTEKSEEEKREEAEKAAAEAKSKEMPPQNVTEKSAAEIAAAAKAAEDAEAAKKAGSAPPVAPDLTKAISDLSALFTANTVATQDAITKALNGQKILEGNVHTLMDALSGGTIKTAPTAAPDLGALMKGNPQAAIEKLNDTISEAIDSGRLDERAGAAAQSLLGSFDAVQKGAIDISIFQAKLANAPSSVRGVFAEVAQAAAA